MTDTTEITEREWEEVYQVHEMNITHGDKKISGEFYMTGGGGPVSGYLVTDDNILYVSKNSAFSEYQIITRYGEDHYIALKTTGSKAKGDLQQFIAICVTTDAFLVEKFQNAMRRANIPEQEWWPKRYSEWMERHHRHFGTD
jgi:hypothetical protein